MTADMIDAIEAPGFRGRIVGLLEGMPVIDAVVTGEIDSHVAISDEFAVVLSGQLTATIDGVERVSRAGDYLVVPAGAQHGIVPDGECRLLLIGRI